MPAVALPAGQALKVTDHARAAGAGLADEDPAVVGTRMPAVVAERRVLAGRAQLERATSPFELGAAVSAEAEHARRIGA
jgi:hypothetical protein